jgi:hypothetical protein
MSSGYSLVQETADSIDEVTLSQVPRARKNFKARALKGVESFPPHGFGIQGDESWPSTDKRQCIQAVVGLVGKTWMGARSFGSESKHGPPA